MNTTDIDSTKITYDLQPYATNAFLLRVYNLADRFDDKRELGFDDDHFTRAKALAQVKSKQVSQNDLIYTAKLLNLQDFAISLYYLDSGNNDSAPVVNITEVNLSGTQSLK